MCSGRLDAREMKTTETQVVANLSDIPAHPVAEQNVNVVVGCIDAVECRSIELQNQRMGYCSL